MKTAKNAIATGVLVVGTMGIFIAALVVIGMPGVIKKLHTFQVSYDNANGIRPGAPVLLAGREIGKVTMLESPVPMDKRPEGFEHYEVAVTVQVAADAKIYDKVVARLGQQGLMGQQVIDFVEGDESSGLAADKKSFIGERIPEISEALNDHMVRLTGPDSDLAATMKNTKGFMETLNGSEIQSILQNAKEFTETIKTEPWRVLWPSSKAPPGEGSHEQEPDGEAESKKGKSLPPNPKNR